MATRALVNARVLVDDGFRDDLAVLLDDGGDIAALVPASQARTQADEIDDLAGGWLAPGFIDAQVNGGGGVLFNNDTSVEAIAAIGRAHRRFGTTGFLPTLISDDAEVMARAIGATRAAIAAGVPGVLGVHLEGPYIAPARKGTHDAGKFRVPDAAEVAMATSLDNGITLITLAPEQVPLATIRAMAARGAIVVAGHTAASYEQARAGLEAGLRGFTHLYNAMSPLQGREPGAVGAALEDRDSWCGVIVDGVHVHPGSLRVALAAKPRGKLFLVTDAMPMVGSDDPAFALYGEVITAVDGVVRNAAGALAGSALDMATAVRNCVRLLGLPLDEAARMASTYPADFLGLGGRCGRIAAGLQADLVLLDESLAVRSTWIAGVREDVA
ncbi:N-acetylglucosamine-6-phosphate deacetylase [Pseudoxanthomonas kaohsiungensis]|uniref:N-acetylglucosamine-6-phosphate deacetylase n=1 Tax=Pseudoxanthomonas kaohsiungensis TaxID=283923 RepID=A0ABW3LZ65_9GAMM|nr:N-acetylglucosamine-6-phosphate deacetylase [Pseudoxanthomonas kaohsiungensis]KAF1703170.1 N-acetylglucosamine-6-phosphate deacetylase [Pseudoxanthomonas kaohsiungensis]